MKSVLRWYLVVFGVACVLIALAHIFIGPSTIIGANTPNATLDGDIRFSMVLFLAYGVACVWAARDLDRNAGFIHLLMLLFFVGGLVRLLTVAYVGWPHWFYVVMLVVELVMPLVYSTLLQQVTHRPIRPSLPAAAAEPSFGAAPSARPTE
ncbi:DUF4345 domain-containing protein [Nocardia yunnanensis]|uniref:DUF4345 domain-containing protein n=1 Tax=Nocardia yunnanensis TaxID=2382165 RepID=A0A386Z5F6_9NOCA|nr:DUF4345 domain-containing protein [Nocardia yunnanensis]AYF72891.1 DUF4345 domain-containing protein [Nocardia yunnanensis]